MGNQCLLPPERMAAFVDDTCQVASLIPKMRQGVQSQEDALATGAVEAWRLRDAYRESVNKVASEIGRRHKSERVGRALGGARFAYQDQLSSFSPVQGLKDRARMFKERDKLTEGSTQAVEEFRKDQANANSFAAEASKVAQSVGERVQSDQAMAEDAGRSLDSAWFAFQEYGEDKPPVLNTIITDEYNEFAYTIDMIRRSFEFFDNYLKGNGAEFRRFLETVDVFAGDLTSLGNEFQEGMAALRKSLAQSVAFGNLTEGGRSKFLDQFGETVGAVVGQLAGGGGLLVFACARAGGILSSFIPSAGPVGQAIGASLLPGSGAEETQAEATEAATGPMGGRRLNVRQTHNHIAQVVVEVDAVLNDHNPDIEKLADELVLRVEQKLHELSV